LQHRAPCDALLHRLRAGLLGPQEHSRKALRVLVPAPAQHPRTCGAALIQRLQACEALPTHAMHMHGSPLATGMRVFAHACAAHARSPLATGMHVFAHKCAARARSPPAQAMPHGRCWRCRWRRRPCSVELSRVERLPRTAPIVASGGLACGLRPSSPLGCDPPQRECRAPEQHWRRCGRGRLHGVLGNHRCTLLEELARCAGP